MNHSKKFPVEKMCKVFKISRSSYYIWLKRPISKRELYQNKLLRVIQAIHQKSKYSYGAPRITRELKAMGYSICEKTVAKLMRKHGIRSKLKKKFKITTDSKHHHQVAENLLNRKFKTDRKSKVWVSDITYIKTIRGWSYLTVIIDLYDRKVIGWSVNKSLHTNQTILPAWQMAINNRPIKQPLIFHSDRGVQYACDEFKNVLKNPLIKQSMSRKANCWDNAVAESFFKTLKTECIYDYRFENIEQVKLIVFEYIETWYNTNRRHSALNNKTINEFEKLNRIKLAA